MGWKTIIIGSECCTSISLERMKITIGEDYQTIPLCDIDTVIFSHDRVIITIPLLSELVAHNINIVICDSKNDPIGIFQPFNNHSLVFKQLMKQINWKITRKKKLWKRIVERKIESEINVLKLIGGRDEIVNRLKQYKESVYNDDQTNREGASARIYFLELFGKEFNRELECVQNHALNYGYKIIASCISRCLVSRGLLTQLGIHHIGESNPFNLTYDIIEPFRAVIDIWVYLNIKDEFSKIKKIEIIEILNYRVFVDGKKLRLKDAIEDIVDSIIAFMNEERDDILFIDLSKGIINEV